MSTSATAGPASTTSADPTGDPPGSSSTSAEPVGSSTSLDSTTTGDGSSDEGGGSSSSGSSSGTSGGGTLLGSLEWPFNDYDAADFPDPLVIRAYYNGFQNPAPCQNAQTTLSDVDVDWNTTPVHVFDATTDANFAGFALCVEDGTDQALSLQIEGVSGWGVEESNAIDTGMPDLVGHTVERIELVVEDATVTGVDGDYNLHIEMHWDFYGT